MQLFQRSRLGTSQSNSRLSRTTRQRPLHWRGVLSLRTIAQRMLMGVRER